MTMQGSRIALALGIAFVPHVHAQTPPDVVLRWQIASHWCWAASAEMVMEALGAPRPEVRQALQAGRLYPPADQCHSNACAVGGSASAHCNRGGFPQFYKFGYEAETTRPLDPLSWLELSRELNCGPVVFAWEWLDKAGGATGTGHMMVATAAKVEQGEPWVEILDPSPPCKGSSRCILYDEYREGPKHVHWIDYYGLRKAGTLRACPELKADTSLAVLESISPTGALREFNERMRDGQWSCDVAELNGDPSLDCDEERHLRQENISVDSLRRAPIEARLSDLAFETGRRRYLCNSRGKDFLVQVMQRPSQLWRVASVGDTELATRIRQALPSASDDRGSDVREVFVQGLNVYFLRFVREGEDFVIPLSSNRDLEINPEGQTEKPFLEALRRAAQAFVVGGPT